jgi:putative membrane protein
VPWSLLVLVVGNAGAGIAVAAVAVALARRACALGTYVFTRAVPAAVLTSRERTWMVIARAACPGATVAILAAVALSLILIPVLSLTALTFMALNQVGIHRGARAGSGPRLMFTIPAALHAIGGYLPTHAAILAVRGVIIGSDIAMTGIAALAAWLIVGALATVLVTEQRRVLSSKRPRLGSVRSPAT